MLYRIQHRLFFSVVCTEWCVVHNIVQTAPFSNAQSAVWCTKYNTEYGTEWCVLYIMQYRLLPSVAYTVLYIIQYRLLFSGVYRVLCDVHNIVQITPFSSMQRVVHISLVYRMMCDVQNIALTTPFSSVQRGLNCT